MEKVTVDTILGFLKEAVESKRQLSEEVWLDAAWKMNVLLGDEHEALEDMRQMVAKNKLMILQGQEKKNVAAAELEIDASNDYRDLKVQEHKVVRIEEFIRIAKKNASKY